MRGPRGLILRHRNYRTVILRLIVDHPGVQTIELPDMTGYTFGTCRVAASFLLQSRLIESRALDCAKSCWTSRQYNATDRGKITIAILAGQRRDH